MVTDKNVIADYRSDTVTRPTPEMREAMMHARVGDDVYGEDPTINELESFAAKMFGKESALFCPSGTMTNQIALMLHTKPGDEVICDELSHIYLYEGGGMAANAGIQPKLLKGDRGRLNATQIQAAFNTDDVHKPVSSLVSLENTSNRGGGSCYDISELQKIAALCREQKVALHLDGARICNAIVAGGTPPEAFGAVFDTISICLSKGLGAPVGSVLAGSDAYIKEARRLRKRFGGGMRQAGFLAAAGLYALKNNVNRLADDHTKAKQLADVLKGCRLVLNLMPVETNIVIFTVDESVNSTRLVQQLAELNIKISTLGNNQFRLVTHLDISEQANEKTAEKLIQLLS